jgi:hypothetical protein
MTKVKNIVIVTATVLAMLTPTVRAEPTGIATLLLAVRPFVGSNTVYIYPADSSPCNTNIYILDISTATGKAAYAIALAAIASGKRVQLEAIAPCTGLYSGLQSIYALPN